MFHLNPAQERRVIRPDRFRLDPRHPLYQGLLIACLGEGMFINRVTDSSPRQWNCQMVAMDPLQQCVYVPSLGRTGWKFDGTDKWISLLYELLPPITPVDLTLAAWVLGSPVIQQGYTAYFGRYIGAYTGVMLGMNWPTNHAPSFFVGQSGYGWTAPSAVVPWPEDQAQHTAGRRQGTSIQLIYNSRVVATSTLSAIPLTFSGTFAIGKAGYEPQHYGYIGIVCDAMMWTRALTLAELQILANRADPMLGGFIVPARRTYFPAAVAAPSFKAAWAKGLNTYIGLGM